MIPKAKASTGLDLQGLVPITTMGDVVLTALVFKSVRTKLGYEDSRNLSDVLALYLQAPQHEIQEVQSYLSENPDEMKQIIRMWVAQPDGR